MQTNNYSALKAKQKRNIDLENFAVSKQNPPTEGILSKTMAEISSKNDNLANYFLFYSKKHFEKVLKDVVDDTTTQEIKQTQHSK
ncbi:MAG: hypothetical protein LAT76_10655 [Schleiferiaceae bacterium]|nr:hypothetical protein [Schleiferiaceae bacterium]